MTSFSDAVLISMLAQTCINRISYLASLIELCQPETKKPWDRY